MVLPAVIILLCFAIFPLIVSIYLSLCRFALAGGSFTLTFIGLYNYKRLLFGAPAISSHRHAEADRDIRLDPLRRLRRGDPLLACPLCQGGIHRARPDRPAHLRRACDRPRAGAARDAAAGGYQGTLLTTCLYVLFGVTAQFVIGLGLALLCAQPIRGAQLLSGRLLHSADGDAGRRRLHFPHARRHAEGAVRAVQRGARTWRLVLGDAGLVGAPHGADRRHLAMDAVHVHRPARRDREPAARPARGGPARRGRAASRPSATSPGRRSRPSRRPSCSSG